MTEQGLNWHPYDAAELSEPINWIGAVSFEERCTGSPDVLHADGVRIRRAVALEYTTEASPYDVSRTRRRRHRDEIDRSLKRCGVKSVEHLELDPYAFFDVQRVLRDVCTPGITTLIDVSCLTKIHAIAAAAESVSGSGRILWAYTVPENYAVLAGPPPVGWAEVLVLPVSDVGNLGNEQDARALILLGHEHDRLIVALAELDVAGGIILVGDAPDRPDIRETAERRNRKSVDHLLGIRFADWSQLSIAMGDWQALSRAVDGQVKLARQLAAPIVVYPFGPKPLIVGTTCRLSQTYADASWFVYPVPSTYDVNYSEGTGATTIFGGN